MTASRSPNADEKAGKRVRLLIVDDDDVDREKLRRMLAASAFRAEMVEAASGKAALEEVRKAPFDCILLDYHLADGLGTDFMKQINAEEDRDCPVILVTGVGNEMIAVQAMREGVYNYLSKHSLSTQHLRDTIEDSLRQANREKELKLSQERLKWLGLYDSLTGLPNRNLFFDRLEQAAHAVSRSSTSFALFVIDLDLFKEVNDSFGHEAGDRVLAEVGRRLQQSARVSDTYARLGGDEFAGILLGIHSVEDACVVAKAVSTAIRRPICVGETTVTVGASIGIALAPLHGTNSRKLLTKADMAMYSAKLGQRNYDLATLAPPETQDDNPVALARQIGDAIDRGELFLHYQPKINLRNGELAGVEALIRWNKPGEGVIQPGEFIPAIERTATIAPLTYAVLDMAFEQMQVWTKRGWRVPVSVNISTRMLDNHELAPRVAAGLAQHDLDPKLLTLEITETSLMTDPAKARRALNDLADVGVAISIDDFGSGYSSLAELQELAIHEIKLDRPFVEGLGRNDRCESIVQSVATLSEGFDVNLVAEGIETRDQMKALKALGCTMGQGFSLAHPMTAREFSTWWPDWQKNEAQSFAA